MLRHLLTAVRRPSPPTPRSRTARSGVSQRGTIEAHPDRGLECVGMPAVIHAPAGGSPAGSGSKHAASRSSHLPGIEGARGIAALSVLVLHVFHRNGEGLGYGGAVMSYGWLGVPLFFVLSGLLLYRPFAHATVAGSKLPSFRRYARARVLRIYPAYWLVLLCTVPILGGFADSPRMWLTHGIEQVLLVQSWFSNDWAGLTPAWTLVIEVTFYAVLPLLVLAGAMLARRVSTPRGRAVGLLLVLAPLIPFSFAYRHIALLERSPAGLPRVIDLFAVGMLLAVVLELPAARRASSWAWVLGPAGVVAFFLAFEFKHSGPETNDTGMVFTLLASVGFALILGRVLLAGDRPTLIGRVLSWRPVVWLGTVSYGIYLWHWPVIYIVGGKGWHHGGWPLFAGRLALVLAVTLAAAATSWYVLERRLLALKDGFRPPNARDPTRLVPFEPRPTFADDARSIA